MKHQIQKTDNYVKLSKANTMTHLKYNSDDLRVIFID